METSSQSLDRRRDALQIADSMLPAGIKAPVWVATQAEFARIVEAHAQRRQVCLDSESDSFYRYPERICLIQMQWDDQAYLVDTLVVRDLSPMVAMMADPAIEKAFHAAEYDISCFKRVCPSMVRVEGIFDTMAAAQILGWKDLGLAALIKNHFNVTISKALQKSNWGYRPLSRMQMQYAAIDVSYLSRLAAIQEAQLRELWRMEEAREEFDRLGRTQTISLQFDPQGYHYIRGASRMDDKTLSRLRELYLYREAQARARHVPPFRIFGESVLEALAQEAPTQESQMRRIMGLTPFVLQRYGRDLLRILRAAPDAPPAGEARERPLAFDYAERQQLVRLKEWRKAKAQERGVSPDVIVSNDTLIQVVRLHPRDKDALSAASVMGPWKFKTYADDILRVLQQGA